MAVTAAHSESQEAWGRLAAEKAVFDADVQTIFSDRIADALPFASIADDSSDTPSEADTAAMPIPGYRLWVDPAIIGAIRELVLTEASGSNRVVLDAIHACFAIIPSWEPLPTMTFKQLLGRSEQSDLVTIHAMVGPKVWGGLFGPCAVCPADWVPAQLGGILRHQTAALQSQLSADPQVVDDARTRMLNARTNNPY